MNIFEGARRLTRIGCAAILIAGAVGAVNTRPHTQLERRVLFPSGPVLMGSRCDTSTDATAYKQARTESGKDFSIRFCFAASKSKDGRLLVPYSETADLMLLNEKYSSEVSAYTKRYAADYIVTPADLQEAEALYDTLLWQGRGRAMGWALGVLFFFWLFSKLTGWVVRGFMGIPSGNDKKSPPAAQAEQSIT
jgi:hypothetical protein